MSKNGHIRTKRRSAIMQDGVYQDVLIANPHDPARHMKVRFLVDTGSSGTVIPRKVAEFLKLDCVGEGLAELADGRQIKTNLAYLYLNISGEHVFTLVSYNGCKTPLLGFDVISVLGLQLDMGRKRFLKPVRRFNLISFILNKGWMGGSKKRRRKRA